MPVTHSRWFRSSAMMCAAVFILGCGAPAPLTVDMPLHPEEHLEAATIVGSEVSADPPEPVEWLFDKPQPDWRPAKPIPAQWDAVEPVRVDDALRLSLTARHRHDGPRLIGSIYIDLPDWNLEDWAYVEIRARTRDPMSRVGLAFNYTEEDSCCQSVPFYALGGPAFLVTDGTVQTYRLSLDWPSMRSWEGSWTHLAIWFTSQDDEEAVTLDILSIQVISRDQSFAVRQVRVFDGDRLHTDMTVVVQEGVIQSLQADTATPPGIEVIDGTGRTLLPGLFDSHTHMEDNALTQALAFGVTTVLDMFTSPSWAAERREEQRQGAATGRADLLAAGLVVTAPGGHGTQYGIEVLPITTPEEAREAVEIRLASGSDYIKIIYQPVPCERCYSIDSATMHAVIAETHRRDRMAVVHVHTLEYGRTAIQAGADAIVHLFADRVADAAFLELIRESGAFVVPTLSVIASFGGERGAEALVAHPEIGPYLSGEHVKTLITYNPNTHRWFQFDSAATSLRMLADRGVPILAGSDPDNIGTAWGASMHRELELMVRAGLSPTAALRAATSVPARVFGLDDRGRIAPGLRADLLLVDGDPTADILATRNIVAIWKQGVRFDREAYRTSLQAEGDP